MLTRACADSAIRSTRVYTRADSRWPLARDSRWPLARVCTPREADLGTLGFLFWVETFVALLLAPWAIAAAYGGVRIYSQLFFLSHT